MVNIYSNRSEAYDDIRHLMNSYSIQCINGKLYVVSTQDDIEDVAEEIIEDRRVSDEIQPQDDTKTVDDEINDWIDSLEA